MSARARAEVAIGPSHDLECARWRPATCPIGGIPLSYADRIAKLVVGFTLVWAVLVVAVGVASLPLAAVTAGDHGSYCESDDHPGPCPGLVPWVAYALAAIVGGSWSFGAGVAFLRGRPRPDASRIRHRRLAVALAASAAALLGLGVWAASEDTATRLSAPGRGLLALAVVNAAVSLVVVAAVAATAVRRERGAHRGSYAGS